MTEGNPMLAYHSNPDLKKRNPAYRHGYRSVRRRPEYMTWQNMIQRCHNPRNPSYAGYGGRGVTVCAEWRDFARFIADMGERPSSKHSIERLDGALGYQPGNCKWATDHEQTRNTRANRRLTATLCLTDWAKLLGVSRTTLRDRLRKSGNLTELLRAER